MRALSVWTFLLMAVASAASGSDTTSPLAASGTAPANTTATADAPPTDHQELESLSKSLEELLGEPLDQLMEEAEERDGGVPSELFESDNNAVESYSPMSPQHKDIASLVSEFMRAYESEIEATNLDAEVLRVIKAEKTAVRPVLAERSVGLGLELIEEELAQQFRIVVLVKYHFQSSMFTDKRPYVTAMRVTMDCTNTTTTSDSGVDLACDVTEHIDLPRSNESTAHVPEYLHRAIALSAPAEFVEKNQSALARLHFDALESQDLLYDGAGKAVHGVETIKYVRFRVSDRDAQDCMVVAQHAEGVSTLLYSDAVCYNDYLAPSLAMAALQYTKDNYEAITVVAAVVGAIAAVALLYHRRSTKRSGYAYLPSKNGLPRLASQRASVKAASSGSSGTGEDVAIAS